MATQANIGGDSADYTTDIGWAYTVVDLSNNSTTVAAVPSVIGGIYVTVVTSAHVNLIKDGAVLIGTIPASQAVNFDLANLEGLRTVTSLVVDPDDSATGTIIVKHRPV